MSQAKDPKQIILRNVRLSYVFLQEQAKDKDTGEEVGYSCQVLVEKNDQENIKKIRKAIEETVKEKWGADKKNWPAPYNSMNFDFGTSFPNANGFPLKDGDEKATDENDPRAGHVFINAKNRKKRPECGVVKGKGWQRIPDNKIAEVLYSGCYGDVIARSYPYENDKSKGVSFDLRAVMKTADGERLGGDSAVNLDDYYSDGQQGDFGDDFDAGDDDI